MKNLPELRFPEFLDEGEWEPNTLIGISNFINKKISLEKLTLNNYISTENLLPDFAGITVSSKLPNVKSVTHFKKNDILISNIRPYLKKAWFSSLDGGASNDVIVVRAKTETNNKYLAFLLMNDEFINYVMKSAKGVKMPRGDIATMKQYPLSIPSSTDEQQKIADCLSSIDELITSQIKKVEALKEHKKGLVQQLFPQDDEEVPKLRFPEFKNTPKWNEDTLIKIAKFRRGSFPQPYGLAKWYDDVNGMPFVQVYDVNNNLHLKSTTKRKISEVAMQQSVFIKKGTLIITIQGSIGRVAITQYDAYIDRTLLLFEEFFKPINKLFFAYIIQTLFAIEKEKAPGGIIKTITKEVLSSFVVKLTSIEEQEKIADFIFSIDNLIDSQSKKVKALKEHKKGLMQQLFV